MKGAIDKALKDLDGLGERAIRTRILGIEDEEEGEPAEAKAAVEGDGEDEEEMDDDLKQKLIDLLSQE